MRTRILIASVSLSLLSFIPISAFGQQTGEIRGFVTDDAKSPLPGVAITAKSSNLQGLRTAVTDQEGNFRLPLLPIGVYSLSFDLTGFERLTFADQEVRLGFTVSLSIVLEPAKLKEEVTVIAPTPLIDKIKSDNSYRINSNGLAFVPTQARTIAEIVNLTPSVTNVRTNTVTGGANTWFGKQTGSPSFRGEGASGNNWIVDGLSTKNPLTNDSGTRINYDAWEEVQVISDGFAPEWGQALGGFINIVTKSGSNEFHGAIGGLILNPHLQAERRPQLSIANIPETSSGQYYSNVGGPIIKDKLWFFLSDNYFRTTDVSSQNAVGWLKIPGGTRRVDTNNIFGKLTFALNENHTLSLSGTFDTTLGVSGGIGVPETYTKDTYTDYLYRLNYKGILSQNTLLTAALGQNRRKDRVDPVSGDYGPPSYYWYDIDQRTNNIEMGSSDSVGRTDIAAALTHFLDLGRWGNHEFKIGGSFYAADRNLEYRFPGWDIDPWPGDGFDNGTWIEWAAPGLPHDFMEFGVSEQINSTKGFGLNVQDEVVLGRFSFMLGLRTDTQKVFNNIGQLCWSWGLGDFLQPRASLSVDLSGDVRNVLKFGYGRYAVPISLQSLSFFNTISLYNWRMYVWTGLENPTQAQLKDPSNWAFFYEQSSSGVPEEIDSNLKPNKTDKFLLEFDRLLAENWALKLRGIYSYSNNLIEDIGIYDQEVPQLVKYLLTNFDLKRRDYKALEVELSGKIADKLWLNASYTWSQARGIASGNLYEPVTYDSPGWNSMYETSAFGDRPFVPEGAPEKEFLDTLYQGLGGRGIGEEGWYGFMPYSVDHIVKILATYFAPYGVVLSSNIEFLSGYHWGKKGWSPLGFFGTYPEGRGGRVTPAHMYVDLAAEKDFRLKNGMTLGLGINAHNILNSQIPVSYVMQDNELFDQVWARQIPRRIQLKMMMRF